MQHVPGRPKDVSSCITISIKETKFFRSLYNAMNAQILLECAILLNLFQEWRCLFIFEEKR